MAVTTKQGIRKINLSLDLRPGVSTDILIDAKNPSLGSTHAGSTGYSSKRPFLLLSKGDSIKLSDNLTLDFPAGAVESTQLSSANIFDNGDEYPLIDFYPGIHLKKPASLTVNSQRDFQLKGEWRASVADSSNVLAMANSSRKPVQLNTRLVDNDILIDTSNLGIFSIWQKNPPIVLEDGQRFQIGAPASGGNNMSAQALTTACGQTLYNKLSSFISILDTQGSLRIKDCEEIFPYVNIVIVKMNYASLNSSTGKRTTYLPKIARNVKRNPTGDFVYGLDSIRDLASTAGAFTSINGFQWQRDALYGNLTA